MKAKKDSPRAAVVGYVKGSPQDQAVQIRKEIERRGYVVEGGHVYDPKTGKRADAFERRG